MKAAAFILPLLLLSCKDGAEQSPKDASRIEGFWQSAWHPDWLYYFSDGYSEQRIVHPGQTDEVAEYSYSTVADTVFLSDIHSGLNRVWLVLEIGEDAATVREIQPGPLVPIYKLRRL